MSDPIDAFDVMISKDETTTTSLTLTWDFRQSEGHSTGWKISYVERGTINNKVIMLDDKTLRQHKIDNLHSGKGYEVRLWSTSFGGKLSNTPEMDTAFVSEFMFLCVYIFHPGR